jgi:hypothetical protein
VPSCRHLLPFPRPAPDGAEAVLPPFEAWCSVAGNHAGRIDAAVGTAVESERRIGTEMAAAPRAVDLPCPAPSTVAPTAVSGGPVRKRPPPTVEGGVGAGFAGAGASLQGRGLGAGHGATPSTSEADRFTGGQPWASK